MTHKGGSFRVALPQFDRTLRIYYGEAGKAGINRWFKTCGTKAVVDDDNDGCTDGTAMWVEDPENDKVIIHELYHLVRKMAKYIGIRSGEFSAYTQGYLYGIIVNRLKKRGARK